MSAMRGHTGERWRAGWLVGRGRVVAERQRRQRARANRASQQTFVRHVNVCLGERSF
jgi:hypothetical protein